MSTCEHTDAPTIEATDCGDVTVTDCTLRRWVRVGACPVLEVAVTYPQLACYVGEGANAKSDVQGRTPVPAAVERFNRAYPAMAEAFLSWAQGAPAEAAIAAFHAYGMSAAYCFDRRIITCRMTARVDAPDTAHTPNALVVERTVWMGSRHGEVAPTERRTVEEWRWPSLTLRAPRRHRRTGDDLATEPPSYCIKLE